MSNAIGLLLWKLFTRHYFLPQESIISIIFSLSRDSSWPNLGSGKSYIWEIENKGVKRPSAEKLAAIAKALDVTTDYLIDDTQTEVFECREFAVYHLY
jgi:hypothetical protein